MLYGAQFETIKQCPDISQMSWPGSAAEPCRGIVPAPERRAYTFFGHSSGLWGLKNAGATFDGRDAHPTHRRDAGATRAHTAEAAVPH